MVNPKTLKVVMKITVFPSVLLFFFTTSCGDKADEKYVRQIEQQGVTYSEYEFRTQVEHGKTDIVRLFLQAGMDPDVTHTKRLPSQPPLCTAAENGRSEVVSLLIEYGADPNLGYYRDDKSPLMFAAEKGHVEIVTMLIEAGAKVDHHEDGNGYTALLFAARDGHTDVVTVLIDRGAEVNFRSEGWQHTALLLAAKKGHVETVRHLLAKGAGTDLKDQDGKTARDVAEEVMNETSDNEQYQEILQLLKSNK